MFSSYVIDSITNGVHAATWTSPAFQVLFDKYIPGWRDDSFSLRYALSVPRNEIWQAHIYAKQQLLRYVNRQSNIGMDADIFTIGLARRITPYKRPDLLFTDLQPAPQDPRRGRPDPDRLCRQGPSAGPGGQGPDRPRRGPP